MDDGGARGCRSPLSKLRGIHCEPDRGIERGRGMKRTRKPRPELSPEVAACQRLSKDGASSTAAVRRRIALIVAEQKLGPLETKAVLPRRLTLYHLGRFAEKY